MKGVRHKCLATRPSSTHMKDYKVRTYNSAQCGGTHLSFEYSGERGKISEAVYRAQSDFQGSRVTQSNPGSQAQKIIY